MWVSRLQKNPKSSPRGSKSSPGGPEAQKFKIEPQRLKIEPWRSGGPKVQNRTPEAQNRALEAQRPKRVQNRTIHAHHNFSRDGRSMYTRYPGTHFGNFSGATDHTRKRRLSRTGTARHPYKNVFCGLELVSCRWPGHAERVVASGSTTYGSQFYICRARFLGLFFV